MAIRLHVEDEHAIPLSVSGGDSVEMKHSEAFINAISPTARVDQTEDGAVVTITDKNGTTTAELSNGSPGPAGPQGPKGDTGATGPAGSDADVTAENIEEALGYVPMEGMTILSYGHSTWNEFLEAYEAKRIVYCKASSGTDPATGKQSRMAFLAYVQLKKDGFANEYAEFQYYRSVNPHTNAQQGDQVFCYGLDATNGGTWAVYTRQASSRVVAGTGLASAYTKDKLTLSLDADYKNKIDTLWTGSSTHAKLEQLYNVFPVDSASGAVASFTDGADNVPLKSLVVGINPVQSGEGDPSPENIRPITGWTGANITMCGRNLVGVRGTWDANGGKTSSINGLRTAEKIPCVPGEVFTGYKAQPINLSSANMMIREYGQDGKFIRSLNLMANSVTGYKKFTVPANIYYIAVVQFGPENFDFGPSQLMFYKGADEADFEPYAGSDITVSWAAEAGTVYGGTLDVLTGVLTVEMATDDMGNLTWSTQGSAGRCYSISKRAMIKKGTSAGGYDNAFAEIYSTNNAASMASLQANQMSVDSAGNIQLYDTRFAGMTGAQIKAELQGVTMCYKLAEPIAYQLTPHEVKSLLGINTIYADTGNTSVEYRADIKAYINRKIAEAIAALS